MITIVLPISRSDYLKEVFRCLSELEKPDDTELLIVIDGDKKLEKTIDKHIDTISFSSIRIINHTQRPAVTINERRYRISDIHNQAKHCISANCEYVFSVEDDTTYSPDTLNKLRSILDYVVQCKFAQGVELGRHNTPYIGAWTADDLTDPQVITSVNPGWESAWEKIDAGGLYCALIDAEKYRNHHFEPFDKIGTNGLGCDVNFGLSLRDKGYTCYMDRRINCSHLTDKGPINVDNTEPAQVAFKKTNDKWKARTL